MKPRYASPGREAVYDLGIEVSRKPDDRTGWMALFGWLEDRAEDLAERGVLIGQLKIYLVRHDGLLEQVGGATWRPNTTKE